MIEGIAEAIAKDASPESTLDQIISAESPYPSPQQMKNALSNSGFYSSASSISYTTAGSFVQFLLNNYPVEHFKRRIPLIILKALILYPLKNWLMAGISI